MQGQFESKSNCYLKIERKRSTVTAWFSSYVSFVILYLPRGYGSSHCTYRRACPVSNGNVKALHKLKIVHVSDPESFIDCCTEPEYLFEPMGEHSRFFSRPLRIKERGGGAVMGEAVVVHSSL
jgi:hypothetical protein